MFGLFDSEVHHDEDNGTITYYGIRIKNKSPWKAKDIIVKVSFLDFAKSQIVEELYIEWARDGWYWLRSKGDVGYLPSGSTRNYSQYRLEDPGYNSGAEYLYGTAGHYNGSDNDNESETDYTSGAESFYG